jgi:hypothetical protein
MPDSGMGVGDSLLPFSCSLHPASSIHAEGRSAMLAPFLTAILNDGPVAVVTCRSGPGPADKIRVRIVDFVYQVT